MNSPEEIKKEEIKKEEQIKESSKEEKSEKASIVEEGSINLIPVMSGEDIKEEKRKVRMNKASLISLLFLLGVSIIVIGFSIITRVQLNYQKEKLFKYEEELSSFNQIIIDNDQILERVALYDDVQKDRYSITKVVKMCIRDSDKPFLVTRVVVGQRYFDEGLFKNEEEPSEEEKDSLKGKLYGNFVRDYEYLTIIKK